jgi:glycosyltransferase involved in cell wall biosynthesis
MRILQVGKYLPPVTGGIETVVFELSSGLSKLKNVEVTCLVTNTKAKTVRERINNFDVIRAASFGSLASTPISLSFRSEERKIVRDLSHIHLPNPLATATMNQPHTPYVVTYHCDIVRYKKLLKLYEPSMRRFLKGAAKILVSSEALIETSPVLRDFKEKCVVIPFAVDETNLALNGSRTVLKDKIIDQHGPKIILFVGRLVRYKGLPYLIEAMKQVDGKLVIVGTGPESEILKRYVQSESLSDKVKFEGYVKQNDLGAYYHAAKAVALTSLDASEAFGVCLIEALACGVPLVTTRLTTGVSSVNVDGVTGLQVPVGDVNAIAAGLNRILDDKSLRETFSENARAHFQKNFGLERMAQDHLNVYREVLGR